MKPYEKIRNIREMIKFPTTQFEIPGHSLIGQIFIQFQFFNEETFTKKLPKFIRNPERAEIN